MPSKLDKEKLPINLNQRIKLRPEQKEKIREIYKIGNFSQRELAKKFNVSRRTITFAIYPERYELAKERRRKAWAEGKYREYYNKEKHRKAIQSIRLRKKLINK